MRNAKFGTTNRLNM